MRFDKLSENEIGVLFDTIKENSKKLAIKDYNLRLEKINQIMNILEHTDDDILSEYDLNIKEVSSKEYIKERTKHYIKSYSYMYNMKREQIFDKKCFISQYLQDIEKITFQNNIITVKLDNYVYCHNFTKVRLIDLYKIFKFLNLHFIGLELPVKINDKVYLLPLNTEKSFKNGVFTVDKDFLKIYIHN